MAKIEEFQGFFSYARHDAETDPEFVAAFSRDLEMRVNGKLTNARSQSGTILPVYALAFCGMNALVMPYGRREC